ncbi:hypothetical protein GYH30_053487 [Glycine max]|uniref:uncharacterized protein isoform X3 n=1 Tax=Glycine max TaxID=3847 RepID=UPI000233F47B|nr:uncharacterized protein LOC100817687 isoform X3 [Glycine max]XP_006604584.1 uncharacterized protein LOC100817687 isoform X3 [Glycine max]XP_028217273.1 uncharacterized protein LOC114399303 isoform X3 [Glycine soja]XP_028217274.1 uncharacterized protein LOC114399303 isoform X3 [Glycine soja]XP_028217276.1 uncharacterized protein LOC114399303 isoform X3 [Glycine soja]KAH1078499.1 hypothetical protein GYH30_053487 [Glycine max]|eukprot:XP_006604583.1 uncharacterized protein LOC100817687 isoform X3 [Glycine max]
MDISNQILLIAQKREAVGGMPLLTKMSLMSPFEMQGMLLPSGTSGVKDLYISPSHSSLALFASLGKKLSVLRFLHGLVHGISTIHITYMLDYRMVVSWCLICAKLQDP